jgi:SAM-dependent methyltransferase
MPPASLIIENGIGHVADSDVVALFHAYGHGLVSEMQNAGIIKATYRVLDVGCGLGRLARVLTEILSPGASYVGIDVNKSSIEWCLQNYTAHQNFHFIHADVYSTHYNRGSRIRAADYKFPFADKEFDCVFSTSLFTHLVAA